jgi:hypothetical protein
MARRAQLTGKQYGKLLVCGYAYTKNNKAFWECRCDCGHTTYVSTNGLNRSHTSSCGCLQSDRHGKKNHNWKNGEIIDKDGYILKYYLGHPRAKDGTHVREHILIAESVIKRSLKQTECLHHIDENKANNKNNNLVICQNQAYHMLLHKRLRALKSCGDASWIKCKYCKEYGDPRKLFMYPGNNYGFHRECHNLYERQRRSNVTIS